LKKKLLNKLVYKFSETIFAPEQEAEEESKQLIVTTEDEIEQDKADKSIYGFKLLWFTMQHFFDTEQCRDSSQGAECVWQDPDGMMSE
jgi:hypothetical protein